jgi:nucleoside-diphosphate-sugar epimerase
MPFRILVTGSSGFIGSAVVSALAASGHSVRAASRRRAVATQNNVEWAHLPDLEFAVDWDPLVAGMDIVVHLAAIAHRGHADSPDYEKVNRIATAELASVPAPKHEAADFHVVDRRADRFRGQSCRYRTG